MIKILVPTDFSANANNALDYAIAIANQFGGRIVLYHVFQVQSSTGSFVSIENFMRADAEDEMKKIILKTRAKLSRKTLLEYKIARDYPVPYLSKVADQADYDLIVMGTQGATGLQKIFMGSNTVGIINHTHTPVLAVPNEFSYRPLERIVLAMDSEPISEKSVIGMLMKFIHSYQSELAVFHLEEELVDAGIDPSVDSFLAPVTHTVYQRITQDKFSASIKLFVQEQQADLLCLIRRKRGILYELFHPSVTKREIFESPVPLLVLHD